jgi:WD40 repeat protein
MDIRDTFGYPKQTQAPQNMTDTNVTITHVVWSPPQKGDEGDDDQQWLSEKDSLLAAAGSNGVFCIWNARRAFLEGTASTMGYPPDAILRHSSRAVNRLAWHPRGKYPGHLLTASQDGTVKLWVRKLALPRTANERKPDAHRSWFGHKHASPSNQSYSWECSKTFNPKSEAIREVRWSPFHDNSKQQHIDVLTF